MERVTAGHAIWRQRQIEQVCGIRYPNRFYDRAGSEMALPDFWDLPGDGSRATATPSPAPRSPCRRFPPEMRRRARWRRAEIAAT